MIAIHIHTCLTLFLQTFFLLFYRTFDCSLEELIGILSTARHTLAKEGAAPDELFDILYDSKCEKKCYKRTFPSFSRPKGKSSVDLLFLLAQTFSSFLSFRT